MFNILNSQNLYTNDDDQPKKNNSLINFHMSFKVTILLLFIKLSSSIYAIEESSKIPLNSNGKHLFILSGQSNMQGHRPEEAFTPTAVSYTHLTLPTNREV